MHGSQELCWLQAHHGEHGLENGACRIVVLPAHVEMVQTRKIKRLTGEPARLPGPGEGHQLAAEFLPFAFAIPDDQRAPIVGDAENRAIALGGLDIEFELVLARTQPYGLEVMHATARQRPLDNTDGTSTN